MKTAIKNPHDVLFKLSLAEIAVAKEFFHAHLPAHILKQIDFETLELEKDTFVDEAYKRTESDVLYKAKINDRTAYLYLLSEHQSTVDKWLAFRLLRYMIQIMDLHRKQHPENPLPFIYPIVIYSGAETWNAPLDIFQLFGEAEDLARDMFLKPYQLLDIHRTSDDALRQQQLSGLMAFALKHRKTQDFRQFLKELFPWMHILEVHHETHGISLSRAVLTYVIDGIHKGDHDLLIEEAQHSLSQTLQGGLMTIAQQLEEKGLQKGIQQGMQQGEAAVLKRLLQRRFSKISAMYMQKIDHADADILLHWSEQILDAKTLEDVFK